MSRYHRSHHRVLPVGQILPKFLESRRPQGAVPFPVLCAWEQAVGESIKRITRPVRLKDGFLQVEIVSSSAAWVSELTFLKNNLLDKLWAISPDLRQEVLDLRFIRGRVQHSQIPSTVPAEPSVSPAEKEQIERDLAQVEDDELRTALRGLRLAALKRQHHLGKK